MLGLTKAKARIRESDKPSAERVSIILPVLNEAKRIESCLRGLIAQAEEVLEILVVDGGSTDGTQSIVENFCSLDSRVKLLDASPVDPRWTGKVWGLNYGLQCSSSTSAWILCVDADVTVAKNLVRSLLAHADSTGVSTFSVATRQHLSGNIDTLLHPPMLTTLIYRFGSPGTATNRIHKVQANGQCFLSRRARLLRSGAFGAARTSLCEDITIVRRLAECGETVGFYESDDLVAVRMYDHWRETWNNWPRSLPMRDQYFGWRQALALIGTLLCQAMPLATLVFGLLFALPGWILLVAALLFLIRIGVLFGVARVYPNRLWTYWLSPVTDLPVILRILQFALRRRHSWRGRTYVRRKGGTFEPVSDAN